MQIHLKKNLPRVSFAGVLTHKDAKELTSSSGYIILEYLRVRDMEKFITSLLLNKDLRIPLLYRSSYNHGVCCIVKFHEDNKPYSESFAKVNNLIKGRYNQESIKDCSQVNRITYLNWDPNVYFNEYYL